MTAPPWPDSTAEQPPRTTVPGFDHLQRMQSADDGRAAVKILPGEYYVTNHDEAIVTLLGSCVSTCVWDPVAAIGGMNHFMIPSGWHRADEDPSTMDDAARYGIFAMEFLINTILEHGGDRRRLLVKIVGGGNVVRGATSIGEQNIRFARDYLATERLPLVGEHVGGDSARSVIFHPLSGEAQVREIRTTDRAKLARDEQAYARRIRATARPGGIELF